MVQQILGIPLKPLSGNVGGARAIAESHSEAAAFQETLLQAQEPQDGVSSWQPGFGMPSLWSALLAPRTANLFLKHNLSATMKQSKSSCRRQYISSHHCRPIFAKLKVSKGTT
jgi:hypothetical protein